MWLKPFKRGLPCAAAENITRRPIVMPAASPSTRDVRRRGGALFDPPQRRAARCHSRHDCRPAAPRPKTRSPTRTGIGACRPPITVGGGRRPRPMQRRMCVKGTRGMVQGLLDNAAEFIAEQIAREIHELSVELVRRTFRSVCKIQEFRVADRRLTTLVGHPTSHLERLYLPLFGPCRAAQTHIKAVGKGANAIRGAPRLPAHRREQRARA